MNDKPMLRATEQAEQTLGRHHALPGWTIITKESHPTIFECFETISHDAGFGAGHTNYSVPPEWAKWLTDLEGMLAHYSADDINTICIGEESERVELLYPNGLKTGEPIDLFLTAFFNDWEEQ